jgi:hypothetical protein
MNIIKYIEPNSASPSIICQGTYNDKPAYFKISKVNKHTTDSSEQGLYYEGTIYKKINDYKNNEKVKNIQAFFLNYLDYKKIYKAVLIDITNNITKKIENYEKFIIRLNSLASSDYDVFRILITEDNDTVTLFDMIKSLDDSYKISTIKIILADLLYPVLLGINILYNVLDINHNDMHFKNILCCKEEKLTAYYIDSNEFYVSRYKINIFDFDLSYQTNKNNNRLSDDYCKMSGSCNRKSFKDYYVFIQSILSSYYIYYSKPNYKRLTQCLEEIFNILVPKEYQSSFIKNMDDILNNKKKLFWSAYCIKLDEGKELTMDIPCNETDKSDTYLYWLKDITEKFRKDFIGDKIDTNIDEPNKFFMINTHKFIESDKNKYIKYKKKYLKLKSTHFL